MFFKYLIIFCLFTSICCKDQMQPSLGDGLLALRKIIFGGEERRFMRPMVFRMVENCADCKKCEGGSIAKSLCILNCYTSRCLLRRRMMNSANMTTLVL